MVVPTKKKQSCPRAQGFSTPLFLCSSNCTVVCMCEVVFLTAHTNKSQHPVEDANAESCPSQMTPSQQTSPHPAACCAALPEVTAKVIPSLAWSRTYLCLASHFNTSIQKFIKVITEFARGCSQLPTLAPCGMDNFSSWLVQVCCCLVQFTLSFLKWLRAWRELQGTKFSISLCVTSHQPFMESSTRAENPSRAVSWNCGTAGSQNLSSNLCAAVSLKAQTGL